MPPLRSDRASRACETCRRLKTRCYPSKQGAGPCLRCETQNQACSLIQTSRQTGRTRLNAVNIGLQDGSVHNSAPGVEERLNKLETVVHTLVDRFDAFTRRSSTPSDPEEEIVVQPHSPSSADGQDAPIFLIKDIADNNRVGQRDSMDAPNDNLDPVANGTIQLEDAYELLTLFRLHYGRWVNFDDEIPIEDLMTRVRASCLLFNSICLVASRHTMQQHTNELAPTFFREAKRLLQVSLLTTPQPPEFFQATLLLSLWSTTIGQVPLSIDSWLLTSYALQQGWASSLTTGMKGAPHDSHRLRVCCTWNHICLAHLQYCVGMGRKSLLQETQIERCADVLDFEIPQFEVRMVAELRLYWIMVSCCCASTINLSNVRTALQAWRKQWSFLFDQPRSQFLEMGYSFAILLAYCRLLHSQTSSFSRSKLNEMVQRAQSIIRTAQVHTDERTPHLTDHIYHVITFSAITLCKLVTKYSNILIDTNAINSLQDIIGGLIDWLRSIGPGSHISRILANIIAIHYRNCMVGENLVSLHSTSRHMPSNIIVPQPSAKDPPTVAESYVGVEDMAMENPFQDLAWTTFFDFDADRVSWPQSNELTGSNYTPTEESWTASAHAMSP